MKSGESMRITSVRSQGLAHLSYYIASEGEALVVDPRRDVDIYIEMAKNDGSEIVHIFETHRNEDYVVGSLELQYHIPGAEIGHSKATGFNYGNNSLADGDAFRIGNMQVTCIHTPGHTDDSMCYAIADITVSEDPLAVFTGDTLFVNEVGRTDLVDIKKHEDMSRKLFRSLHEKLLPLGDGVIVYPGHGAGSVCGGDIGEREFTTLGYERANNKWLQMNEEEFVQGKLNQKLTLSSYFKHCERLNTIGPPIFAELSSPKMLDSDSFDDLLKQDGYVAVDTRSADFFVCGHIPGAISVPISGMGMFGGWVLKPDETFLLVLERPDDLQEALAYLHRIGFDNIAGYLGLGMDGWYEGGKTRATVQTFSIEQVKQLHETNTAGLLDVRQPHETEREYIDGAKFLPLTDLRDSVDTLDTTNPNVIMCLGGVRGTSAASVLLRRGISNYGVTLESLNGWKNRGFPLKKRADHP
jgi:hydroxyacylglutathione hydrolase